MPASWTGFGELLAGAGERVPLDALTLAAGAGDSTRTQAPLDVSGIWALPAALAPARSHVVLRALDSAGRLPLPVQMSDAGEPGGRGDHLLPAERDGALITVFLPGAPAGPRPNYMAAPQQIDTRGRLRLTVALRQQVGIPDGADVLAHFDPDRRTITIVAASRLHDKVGALLDTLRRPAAEDNDAGLNPAREHGDAHQDRPARPQREGDPPGHGRPNPGGTGRPGSPLRSVG